MNHSLAEKVYIGGVFDLFHVGHLNILQQAKALGDYLFVGVLTDEATMRYKKKPVIPEEQRLQIVRALKCVDMAFLQKDTDPSKFGELQRIDPDILVHGDDWDTIPGQEWMYDKKREIVLLPYTQGVSTTEIRRSLSE